MGRRIYDRFSLLHFAVGVVVYYWNISFNEWFIIHMLFEMIENTEMGVKFIDSKIKIWPGGKKSPDNLLNSISDQIFSMLGWLLPYYLYN